MAQYGRRPQRAVQSHSENPAAFNGLWDGVVIDIKDPEKLGRVRVRVFDIHDEDTPAIDLPWADPCFPTSFTSTVPGETRHNGGIFHVPPVNALVYVMFRHGDPDYPVWMGGFHPRAPQGPVIGGREGYTDKQPRDALYNADGVPTCPTWASVGGHRIELDDEAEEIRITSIGGMKVTMSDNEDNEHGRGIKLEDNDGNFVWLDSGKSILRIRMDGDLYEDITGDRHTNIGGSWFRSVGVNLNTNVQGQEDRKVASNLNVDTAAVMNLNCNLAQPQDAFTVDQGQDTTCVKGALETLNNQFRKILTGG